MNTTHVSPPDRPARGVEPPQQRPRARHRLDQVRHDERREEAPPDPVRDRRARGCQAGGALVAVDVGRGEGGVAEEGRGRGEEDGELEEGEGEDGEEEGRGEDEVVDGHVRLE